VEVWTRNGLITFYILVVMRLKTRQVEIAGITESPNGEWTSQMARNLSDCEDRFLKDASYVVVDRDSKFKPFNHYMDEMTDTEMVLLPVRSPNLNAYLERYMRSIKSESLDRMIFFGRASVEKALSKYAAHYHHERNHQGLRNQVPFPYEDEGIVDGELCCSQRLGGMLRYYYRDAA